MLRFCLLFCFFTGGITIERPPQNVRVQINTTAFIYCQASYDSLNFDLTYVWLFNGHKIDFENSRHYVQVIMDLFFLFRQIYSYCPIVYVNSLYYKDFGSRESCFIYSYFFSELAMFLYVSSWVHKIQRKTAKIC